MNGNPKQKPMGFSLHLTCCGRHDDVMQQFDSESNQINPYRAADMALILPPLTGEATESALLMAAA